MDPQARRRDLRLAQDRGAAAQDAPQGPGPGQLDVQLRLGGVQPGPHPQPGRDPRMIDSLVPDRRRRVEWRRPERSQQASADLCNRFETVNWGLATPPSPQLLEKVVGRQGLEPWTR